MISLFEGGIPGGLKGWTIPLMILVSSCLTDFLQAQAPPREPPGAPAQIAPQQLAPEELNRLLAAIALYPDALAPLILTASNVPGDAERVTSSDPMKPVPLATRMRTVRLSCHNDDRL